VLGFENEALLREVIQSLDTNPSADTKIPQGRILAVLVLQAAQETNFLLGEGYRVTETADLLRLLPEFGWADVVGRSLDKTLLLQQLILKIILLFFLTR
jgi:hypothetical protein